MGKTNLLDAVHYLSFCKSHINTPDSQLINNDQDMCVLQGHYDYEGREEDIFCAIRRRQRKQFKRNKKEYDKLSEHIGLLPLVMVSPADSELIQGGSEERRRFLDVIISQQDKSYLHALIQYNKALLQRNSLLKDQCTDVSLYGHTIQAFHSSLFYPVLQFQAFDTLAHNKDHTVLLLQ